MDHDQIQFRKQHLGRYLDALVTKPYDGKMVDYLDMVGKMHTPKAGSRGARRAARADERPAGLRRRRPDGHDPRPGPRPRDRRSGTLRAFSKLLWLQNDLINRHYQAGEGRDAERVHRVA